jgi:hypothetical protein
MLKEVQSFAGLRDPFVHENIEGLSPTPIQAVFSCIT